MSDSRPLLEAHQLCKRYGDFALRNVDLTVRPGEIVGYVGRNGAGKTTTIKALLGLIRPDGGEGTVMGAPIREMGRSEGVAAKELLGVVFDTLAFPDALRIRDINGVLQRCYRQWDERRFRAYLKRFDLQDTKKVKELSRGMGMKLSLACALSHGARLLILDEATAGLDPMARDEVLDLLREFVADDGHGVLMSSHITSDLERIADRVVCIDDGHIVFDKPKDEITDTMGVARCRARDIDAILGSDVFGGAAPRILRHEYGVDLAVPDRFAFAEAFPDIPCDRMTIDDYLHFTIKGVSR